MENIVAERELYVRFRSQGYVRGKVALYSYLSDREKALVQLVSGGTYHVGQIFMINSYYLVVMS